MGAAAGVGLMVGGAILKGAQARKAARNQAYDQSYQAETARQNANFEADSINESAIDQASKLRRLAVRESAGAKASIAASGVALDEFSAINTDAIEAAGEDDAMTTILNGKRQAIQVRAGGEDQGRALDRGAKQSIRSGRDAMLGSLLEAGGAAYAGWKGMQKPPSRGLTTGDFSRMDRGQK
jgi:hypothetical protein